MDMNNEKLQRFIDAVNNEIEGKVNEKLAEAEEEKKTILEEARLESEETADRHMQLGEKKNGNRYVRDISRAELSMKKAVLMHKEELTEQVFSVVEKRLIKYREDPKYVDLLIKNLLLTHVTDDTEIFLAPDDMKHADTLRKAVRSDKVTFSPDEKIKLGGLSVYNREKGTISDKTFDLAVEEQKRRFTNSNAFA